MEGRSARAISERNSSLHRLHAPEMDEALDDEARQAMVSLVEGKVVVCELTGERNHDRLVGVCHLDGEHIAKWLVSQGLEMDYPHFTGGRYKELEREPSASLPLPDYCL